MSTVGLCVRVGLVLAGAALGIETRSSVADFASDSEAEEVVVVVAADKVTVECVRKSAMSTTTFPFFLIKLQPRRCRPSSSMSGADGELCKADLAQYLENPLQVTSSTRTR